MFLMLKLSQIWLAVFMYSWYVPIILWALPSLWIKCSGLSYTFPTPGLGSPISPRSPGSFAWIIKPSLWVKVKNVCIPYIYTLASVFTYIEICVYLVHTNKNTAGFILVFSSSIFVTPFSARSHYLQYIYLLDQFPLYLCTQSPIASIAWPDPFLTLFRLQYPSPVSLKNSIFKEKQSCWTLRPKTVCCYFFGCAAWLTGS